MKSNKLRVRNEYVSRPVSADVARSETGVNKWDAEMAELAKKQMQAEASSAGGNYVSTKGGHFSIGGNIVKGDKLHTAVVASMFVNAYYDQPYQDGVAVSPSCFAINEDEGALTPHPDCTAPQHETCDGCPLNAFGTANVGKGKACKNQRRLALLPVTDDEVSADMLLLSVAPTSTRAWGTYVQQIGATIKRPTCGVLTEISIAPAPGKTYATLSYAFERELTQPELAIVLPRRDEADTLLSLPFPKGEEAPAPAPKTVGKARKFAAKR